MSSVSGLDQPRLLPASLESRLVGFLGRVSGCALLFLTALIWLAVVTWSNADPSLSHATDGPIRNWLGAPGAIVSDLLIETLGLATLAALFAPMLWGFDLVVSERIAGLRTKAAYFPVSVLVLAGAFSAFQVAESWPLEHGYGGILGDVVFRGASTLFALLNPDRAAFASCVLLLLMGLSALSHAVGLGFKDLLRAAAIPLGQGGRTAGRGGTAAARAIGRWLKEQVSEWRVRDAGYSPEPAGASFATWPGGRQEPVFGSGPAPRAAHSHAEAQSAGGDVVEASVSSLADSDDDLEHGIDFDESTDISSRAMAERFAPPGARRQVATTVVEVQRPTLKAQLLGVVAPRKGPSQFKRPALNMLKRASAQAPDISQAALRGTARLLEDVLADFGVKGEVRDIKPGPVVTLFEFEPARGTKTSRIVALGDDIARSMSARSARVAAISGRTVVGIELPNTRREQVNLRDILESETFRAFDGALPLILGKSIGGEPVVADLARMPHLLIAGTTGSGKSVGLNAMILSLLFRHAPDQCRFLMIDPKMLELSVYNGIPHLLCPVVTEPQKAVQALNWAVAEMEERYKRMARLAVRNIEGFNERVANAKQRGEPVVRTVQTGFDPRTGAPRYEQEEIALEPMPYLVVVVDEFADLMIASGKEIEVAVQRLAQKARAAGIHLIMATQRPSVDVLTGTIKANFPTRISFKVASKIDSRTILGEQGAEQLLGHGDMLFASGSGQMSRVHGPLVSDAEVDAIAEFLRNQGPPRYIEGIGSAPADDEETGTGAAGEGHDSLYDRAVAIVLRDRKVSTSYVQRRLSIGYNRAADIVERMEREGLVSAPNHAGRREVLALDGTAPKVA